MFIKVIVIKRFIKYRGWIFNWLVSLWAVAVAVVTAGQLRSGSVSSRARGWPRVAVRVALLVPAARWSTYLGFHQIERVAFVSKHLSLFYAVAVAAQLTRCSFDPSPYSIQQMTRNATRKFSKTTTGNCSRQHSRSVHACRATRHTRHGSLTISISSTHS